MRKHGDDLAYWRDDLRPSLVCQLGPSGGANPRVSLLSSPLRRPCHMGTVPATPPLPHRRLRSFLPCHDPALGQSWSLEAWLLCIFHVCQQFPSMVEGCASSFVTMRFATEHSSRCDGKRVSPVSHPPPFPPIHPAPDGKVCRTKNGMRRHP